MLLKVIACEIALREICFLAAQCPNILDLEFLPQGLHDNPATGRDQIQERIEAVPAGKYDAILLGYGLCGNIIAGIRSGHTPIVIPRAHDCIAFFLGSKARHQELIEKNPGAYYYTSGWLECLKRRGEKTAPENILFLPTQTGFTANLTQSYQEWVNKYGEEEAQFLLGEMDKWTSKYTHGVLIDFEFAKELNLAERVQDICAKRSWNFDRVPGDLSLLRKWLDGQWNPSEFLTLDPGECLAPSYADDVIFAKRHDACLE